MNTKWLMTVSSIILGTTGILLLFSPAQFLDILGAQAVEPLPLLVQLLAGLYLAFAMMNWTIKASVIGGIYQRPLSLGNFAHFFIGTLVLVKYTFVGSVPPFLLLLNGVYALLAALFAWLVFKHPGITPGPSDSIPSVEDDTTV